VGCFSYELAQEMILQHERWYFSVQSDARMVDVRFASRAGLSRR
jgi:hypothetical protein